MQRILVTRLLALELGPMVAAIGVSAYFQRFMGLIFVAASFVMFASVLLSIRDGAVLELFGDVCQRQQDPRWFRFWLAAHFSFVLFVLAGGTTMLLYP
jgi:hypothetical protein